jgi:hypothetical protein
MLGEARQEAERVRVEAGECHGTRVRPAPVACLAAIGAESVPKP